ncbi:HigA family addiction module antitoxin [Pedobacter fastidiosus]|uniref:HigA family addiction module antidote protein n=1 Tax=Pedobacter fastidiosus TaxID=2765361 RepID=A0ABR7KMQ5_9SPHI|nr:HigA family addiction module antitoxin [Pedobacter fastidiosus]MBC6109365.1 HigA family addiction module antidote protein [Pedobacter fastidiosus]
MERGIKENTHPGEILREEVIKVNNLTVLKASELLKVTRPTLSNILNGKASITPNMAIRIEKVFGGNAGIWLRLQTSYDLRKAEQEFANSSIDLHKFQYT